MMACAVTLQATPKKILRSPSERNLNEVIKSFGKLSKDKFDKDKEDFPQSWDAYVSLVSERNNAAHGEDVKVTFNDIQRYYEDGRVVLQWFKDAMWTGQCE